MKRRKNKSKWYKSKGGWIGAVLFTLLLIATIPTVALILAIYGFNVLISDNFLIWILYLPVKLIGKAIGYNYNPFNIILSWITQFIYGFLIGYFIQKKFFKRKR